MKKKLQGEAKAIRSVTLYKDDLDEILELLKPFEIQISDAEFDYDSIEELESRRGQRINNLTLSSLSPLFTLKISRSDSSMTRGGEVETLAPFAQVLAILKRRKRPVLTFIFNPFSFVLFLALVFLLINYVARFIQQGLLVLLSVAVLVPMIILMLSYSSGGLSQVLLLNKHQEQSFWIRNRDTIIITVITNVITAILAFAVAYILFKQGLK